MRYFTYPRHSYIVKEDSVCIWNQLYLYCNTAIVDSTVLHIGEWNDKITTFPGLYILSSLVHGAFKYLWPLESIACSALFLRILNIVLAAFVPIGAALCRGQVMYTLITCNVDSNII